MKKTYNFEYDFGEAFVSFEVDLKIFTPDIALATLNFFTWDNAWDESKDLIDEVLKKYAIEAIKVSTCDDFNHIGVISVFESYEGFCRLDGSTGIRLISVLGLTFDDDKIRIDNE